MALGDFREGDIRGEAELAARQAGEGSERQGLGPWGPGWPGLGQVDASNLLLAAWSLDSSRLHGEVRGGRVQGRQKGPCPWM